ncbi:alcohol dehydrogenase catalytic domain-containing protein [Terrabacter sp. MAHUQ-38]|uniref:alcohol dehydrogenase catalytic domain-containing protein n=1 Tax=unclassified Terrabacter TaxID=2630222 RepID=UPI00165DB977|nr:alcohol dehydrogenase catalytic domain-containing protein [Terrabacter sp. MAHUQ-38]MBC9820865.1 alcohol dehydrogenase catalytic domain-containing protein [Terrabacter sp. MAHUQ-38]
MRAVVYDEARRFEVREVPTPGAGAGEVVVDVQLAGVCGTDLHLHEGGFFASFPLTPGHEAVGTVREVGAGVAHVSVGERVVVDNASACGRCGPCSRGDALFCEHFHSLGVNAPGGFAEALVSPAHKVYAADDLPLDVAVVAEPLACAVHGMDVLGLRPGADVLVVGSGTTGLLLTQLLVHGGAGRVTVAAPTEFKLELARTFGADRVVRVTRDAAETARTLSALQPQGFDVAIDVTGAAPVVETLPSLTATNGTVFVYGMCDEDARIALSPYDVFRRQLTVKGSFAQVNCMDRSLAMLRSGRVGTEGLITHRFPLADYAAALDALAHDPKSLKVVVEPQR